MLALASAIVLFAVTGEAQADRDGHRVRLSGVQADSAVRSPSQAPSARGASTPFDPAPADAPLPSGKPDAERFTLDPGRVTETVQADGTVIIALNGEGMEKMSLAKVDGRAVAQCGSPLEARVREGVPTDFRRLADRGRHAAR